MYKEEYNQQAYPNSLSDLSGHTAWQDGMTLLDYFAGQAMQDIMAKNRNTHYLEVGGNAGVANYAYGIAAAMMEERKKYLTPQTT